MTVPNPVALVLVDYETADWLRVAQSEINRFKSMGLDVYILRLSGLNVPPTSSLASEWHFRKFFDPTRVASPRRPIMQKTRKEASVLGDQAKLAADLGAYFADRKNYPLRAKKALLKAGETLAISLGAILAKNNVVEVSIPNGRLYLHSVVLRVLSGFEVRVSYTEVPYFDPSRATYYLESFPIHDRKSFAISRKPPVAGFPDFQDEREWFLARRENKAANRFVRQQKLGLPRELQVDQLALFATSSPDEFLAVGEGDWAHTWSDQYEAFGSVMSKLPDYLVPVLRLHPNLAFKSRMEFKSEIERARDLKAKFPALKVIGPTSGLSTYDLVDSAQIVVVSQSTIGLEAASQGKRVINVMPTSWDLFVESKNYYGPSHDLNIDGIKHCNPDLAFQFIRSQYLGNKGCLVEKFEPESWYSTSSFLWMLPRYLSGLFPWVKLKRVFESFANRAAGGFLW